MEQDTTLLTWYKSQNIGGFSCWLNLFSFFLKISVKANQFKTRSLKHVDEMAAKLVLCIALLVLCLVVASGSSNTKKLPSEAIQQNRQPTIKNRIHISASPVFSAQRDYIPTTIPIVNQTIPIAPIINPIISSSPPPPPPTLTTPIITAPVIPITPVSPGTWCIASSSASETPLQVALDYACGYGGADCSAIQQSGSCYIPNTLRDHASYAFNSYYVKNPGPTSCVFGGTAQLTSTDPSSGSCHFSGASTTTTPPSLSPPTQIIPTTPSVTPTPISTIPSGSTDYGGNEPSGTSKSADTISRTLLFLVTIAGLLVSVLTTNCY